MEFFTADLCDELGDKAKTLEPIFNSYGGTEKFAGEIITIKLDEDNTDLITLLQEDGDGRVCVADVSGIYVAVVGENLMKLASKNGWSGIVINGYVRDITFTRDIAVGLLSLGTCPRKSQKKMSGHRDITVEIGGVRISSGQTLYADNDGVIVVDEL
jgi:regulator of ribonuclease activity A